MGKVVRKVRTRSAIPLHITAHAARPVVCAHVALVRRCSWVACVAKARIATADRRTRSRAEQL